ncbi:hypothetical protein [Anaeromicropila populeti]|uniref:Uncharacterized protein n=1 Tax=Anaeromicropila populeti TaxID=37658 RepID=A0A1I6HYX7_9FIRM|nr:hypothetical protein [Anaeromicropila populeti]SFR59665.1 hypothetical protein SAMN05661086_00412 [Anaeromicropila populeti]
MKKRFIILSICTMIILVSCFHTSNKKVSLPDYVDLDTLPENYSISNAKDDNCVVFEDQFLVSGESQWNTFLNLRDNEQAATIRIANCYLNDDKVYLQDLSFDGSSYSVKEKNEKEKQYSDIVNISLHFFHKDVRPMPHPVRRHSIVAS